MDILVIGGGGSYKPRNKYFEVGNHPTSDYGSGLDWRKPSFWQSVLLFTHQPVTVSHL